MKTLSLLASLLGISLLISLMIFAPPKPVDSIENISKLPQNQKIIIKGKVIKEYYSQKHKTIILQNSVKLQLPSKYPSQTSLNKNISAVGRISRYENNTVIKILSLKYDS